MAYIETIQNWIGYIPKGIALIRDLLTKSVTALNLPDSTFTIVALVLSGIMAYYFLRQWIVSSMFFKAKTLINLLILILLFYLLLTGVGG